MRVWEEILSMSNRLLLKLRGWKTAAKEVSRGREKRRATGTPMFCEDRRGREAKTKTKKGRRKRGKSS